MEMNLELVPKAPKYIMYNGNLYRLEECGVPSVEEIRIPITNEHIMNISGENDG